MGRKKQLTLDDFTLYDYDGIGIEELPYFLYQVDYVKWGNNFANVLKDTLIKSDKELKLKDTLLKKTDSWFLFRYITLLGAPKSFIQENKLPIFIPIKKRKRNVKKKSTNSR